MYNNYTIIIYSEVQFTIGVRVTELEFAHVMLATTVYYKSFKVGKCHGLRELIGSRKTFPMKQ